MTDIEKQIKDEEIVAEVLQDYAERKREKTNYELAFRLI